jgi:putative PIG3 family NAD(P)H quinone oxidoreductase
MRAITLPSFGGPEALTWANTPDPLPGQGEVLVDVAAAGVNRADTSQRQGGYPPPPGASDILGMECSGRIAALGAGVSGWKIGDEVCALLAGGGYAERVTVPAGQLMPIPKGVSLIDAASLPEVACTVWSNVFQVGRLQPGEVLLVHGGASGIGTMAIQLGVRHGARVFATAGSPEKVSRCRELGAEVAIEYHTEDFVDRITEETAAHGADVILDIIGAAYLRQNVETLAEDGRLVIIGMQGGRVGELDLGALGAKRGSVTSTRLRNRSRESKAAIVAAVVDNVWPAFESGEVLPVIDRYVPIAEAAEAHRWLEAGGHVGKIVLTVD